jgi:EAL domain-containing protein (putative c-di-GMP-specific phosphodiesterase class I)
MLGRANVSPCQHRIPARSRSHLQGALERREFELHYQPQAGIAPLEMSVNVPARQFQRPRLQSAVAQALAETGLAPDLLLLELEPTESTLMEALTTTTQSLSALRHLEVTLAIDDFGTGYSPLAYQKRFPIDRLKLDRSFVNEIDRDPDYLAIAHAVIRLGHNLRVGVIAEGVDTPSQLELLHGHQCEQAKGFLFAHPLSARDMETMVRGREHRPAIVVLHIDHADNIP